MEAIVLRFTGVRPLLMHNVALADPLSVQAKELARATGKNKGKNKTDEGYANIRRAEWFGGLELSNGKLALSSDRILGVITSGARRKKLGKDIEKGVQAADEFFLIKYDGPTDLEKLYAQPNFVDVRSVKIGQSRVQRTRPKLPEWSVDVELLFDATVIDRATLVECAEEAGQYCGIGDFRPRFGRFEVQEI